MPENSPKKLKEIPEFTCYTALLYKTELEKCWTGVSVPEDDEEYGNSDGV